MLKKPANIVRAALAILLCLAALLSSAFMTFAATDGDYDFSKPGAPHNKEISASSLLLEYGIFVTDAEREYLDEFSRITLSYNDAVTTANLTVSHEDAVLTVLAREYRYTAEGGESIVWVPSIARFAGEELLFSLQEGTYIARIDGVFETEHAEELLEVVYTADFQISALDMSSLINQAYNDAGAWADYADYLERRAEYEDKYSVYLEYLKEKYKYDDALAEYNQYLLDLEAYHAAVENNNNYDSALEEYNEKLIAYRQYVSDLAAYNAYREACLPFDAQLSAIEAAGTKMTDGRTAYAAILGDTVAYVLANKHALTGGVVGAEDNVIDNAGIATEALRVLLKEYFELKSFEDRYAYYATNYESFRDNFVLLLQSLDRLYRTGRVRDLLIMEEKDRKYNILVAQLVYISNALSNTEVRSYCGTYTYGDEFRIEGQSVPEILENPTVIFNTGTAVPYSDGYPERVEKPEEQSEPVKPERVEVPAYPAEVKNPGDPPSPVVDEPVAPDVVYAPVGEPSPGALPGSAVAIIAEREAGVLAVRHSDGAPLEITLEKTVTKRVFGATSHSVAFYGTDGVSLLYSVSVDSGTLATYEGQLPEKEPDTERVYSFGAWVDADGEPVNLDSVDSDLVVYPSFTSSPRPYAITFTLPDATYVTSVPYGELPTYPGTPTKADDVYYQYSFSGWDNELVPVSGEKIYTAQFSREYILPLADGGAAVSWDESGIVADATDSRSTLFDISSLLARVGHTPGAALTLHSRFGSVTLSYSTALELISDGCSSLSIQATPITNGYTYRVSVIDSHGRVAAGDYRMQVAMPFIGFSSENAYLGYDDTDGKRVYTPHSVLSGLVSFTASSGRTYEYVTEYEVNLLPSPYMTVAIPGKTARPGDSVTVELSEIKDGVDFWGLYLILPDGSESALSGMSFTMPEGDVTIGVNAGYRQYKVLFKDGDKVLYTFTYSYGDTVTPPKNPSKVSDTVYKYNFLGWSLDPDSGELTELSVVTSRVTYYAVFERELLPERGDEGLLITEPVLRLIIAACIAGGMLLLVVLPSLVLSIVFVILSYRSKKKGQKIT